MKRILVLSLGLLLSGPAGAAVFTVTKTADTQDSTCDDHDCSLREAVFEANRAPGTDVIELPPGIYTLTRTGADEDNGSTGDLDVIGPLILVGRDAGSTILDGNGTDRVLDIRTTAEVFGVTIRNGLVHGGGGGILVRGQVSDRVVLRRSMVSSSRAIGVETGDGGGVKADSPLVVLESTITGNHADRNGGGVYGSGGGGIGVESSTFSGNSAGRRGGGLYHLVDDGSVIVGSTFTANRAGESGGGIQMAIAQFPTLFEPNIQGSILAGNSAPMHPDCSQEGSAGYNVIGVNDGCSGDGVLFDRTGTANAPLDPKLAPLAGIGGPTPVHALLAGSPALDMLPAEACTPTDQLGQLRSVPCDAGAVESSAQQVCLPGGPVLCLQDGRFRVTASWSNADGSGAQAQAVPLTDDTGNYWFFSPDNLELVVKVLDGCGLNDHWWVFLSGLTDRGVELRVDDLVTGRSWTHSRPSGAPFSPRLDTSALDCSADLQLAASDLSMTAVTAAKVSLFLPASAVLIPSKGTDTFDGACGHDCSLREAVTVSNDREGTEVILLGTGVYALDRPGRGEDGNVLGDLDVRGHLAILGAGARKTVLDGGGHDRVLEATVVNSSLEVHGATIRNGRAEMVRSNPHSGAGGGVNADDLTLVEVHVTGNHSQTYGGGIVGVEVEIRDSTLSDNEAVEGGGIGWPQTLRMNNVTVSGNRATYVGGGIAIAIEDQALTSVTITGNSAAEGGGLYLFDITCPVCPQSFSLESSLVAGNSAPVDSDITGQVSASPDPRLTPLGDNGGPTPTHALLADSPAIDQFPGSACSGSDQRGRVRPVDGDIGDIGGVGGVGGVAECDAGAFERGRGCQPGPTTLCVGEGDRFQVTARWTAHGETGDAGTLPLARDTGAFWFFDPANLELAIKVLDGCGVNDRFWIFMTGLTDVGVYIKFEDTFTGSTWSYTLEGGKPFPTIVDTNAFETCGTRLQGDAR